MVQFYGDITKVDVEQRMVWGYASTEAVDSDGETIMRSAIAESLEDYMKFANIREMHQPSAVGVAKEAFTDDKGLYIAAKVVDDDAWAKVQAGVYKGFSIGGKVLKRDPNARKTITKIGLYEISLVDRPANPEATFDVWKVADSAKESDMPNAEELRKALADAEALAKAEASLAATLEAEALAKAEAEKITEVEVIAPVNTEVDDATKVVNTEVDDPVAKAEAALAELKAVVDAHTAPVADLSKFDAAMAALVALGDVGAPVVELFKAAKAEADEAPVVKVASADPKAEEALAKALADVAARDEALVKMTDGLAALTKRMNALEVLPLPPKTLGAGAVALVVEKGLDAAGGVSRTAATEVEAINADVVAKYLDSLTENERAFQIMKAAQSRPVSIIR